MALWSRKQQLRELDDQIKALRAELYTGDTQIRDRLTNVEGVIDGHDATLDVSAKDAEQLREEMAAQAATITEQRALIAALTSRLEGLEAHHAEQLARVEARLGEITEHVLRQVEELGSEIDAAGQLAQKHAETTVAHTGTLDELKQAQARLAAEQVRYDLALRAELAELADRQRRTGRG